jgi:indole-3-glycerol phosphate synthase
MSGDFLNAMARSSEARMRAARDLCPEARMLELARQAPPAPLLRTSLQGFDLIAEVKLRSPAQGALAASQIDVSARVTAYAKAGAAAISVLTEPSRFEGSLEHLRAAAQVLRAAAVPAMRKDFLVDPYQVLEARAAGAAGVLVIVRMLPLAQLEALVDCALELNLFALLEAFDASDIEMLSRIVEPRASRAGARERLLAGVNCRDLASLQIVPDRLETLLPLLPRNVTRVAESGLRAPEDVARVAAAGYEMALVGTALMTGGEPAGVTRAMLEAGRAARPGH